MSPPHLTPEQRAQTSALIEAVGVAHRRYMVAFYSGDEAAMKIAGDALDAACDALRVADGRGRKYTLGR